MTKEDVEIATSLIRNAIATHMPGAAVASGWVSAVDVTAWVDAVSARFPEADRPESMGITALTQWLAERGVTAGRAYILAVRAEWMKARMRAACDAAYAAGGRS